MAAPLQTSLSSSSSSSSSSIPIIDEFSTLVPGLPNDVSVLILAFVPCSHHSRLKSISKSWRNFFSSKTLISLRHLHPKTLSHLLCIFPQDPSISSPFLFDPQNLAWCPIPLIPCNPYVYGLCNFTSISIGAHLYVIGGSLFDTRSFPIDRPSPSASTFRFNFYTSSWDWLSPMISPRGSFACAADPNSGQIFVAGGGSRHKMFRAAGSRMSSVERYDVERDEWFAMEGLPRLRAGCVGFFVGNEGDREFWVMGGYGEERTISGVFPVDEYYKDAVVMELGNENENENGGGRWREVGDMWKEVERGRLGKIVVVEEANRRFPGIFMLDGNEIFRYDMASNRWKEEAHVPKRTPGNLSYDFVALNGELCVITLLKAESTENRRLRQNKRSGTLYMQIYHPKKKTWRSLHAKSPLQYPMDFNTAVVCTIAL